MWSSFVANRLTAWLLYNEGQSWSVRPSSLVDIQDKYIAFCFDQAINFWGRTIEGELEKVEGKNAKDSELKRKAVLDRFLFPNEEGKAGRSQFADPALMFR